MQSKLEQLYEKTILLVSDLSKADQFYLEELIQLRDDVLIELNEQIHLTKEDHQMLKEISEYNNEIVGRMSNIRDEASAALGRVRAFRQQKTMYEQNYSADSYFIDKRK